MDIVILVTSSSRDEPYEVNVSHSVNTLTIHCTCPAGEWGKYCKHKAAVVHGDESALFGDGQSLNLAKAGQWITASNLPSLFEEIVVAETELAAATARAKKAKARTAKAMREGIEFDN